MTATATVDTSPIDLAFSRFITQRGHTGADLALLQQTAALLSAERAMGNSCLDLREHAGRPSPLAGDPYLFPALDAWCEALLASGVCESASSPWRDGALDIPPLVLDEGRLYLWRFHAAEVRLARAINARSAQLDAYDLAESAPLFRQLFPGAGAALDWQALAAVAALRSPLVFVTGGPGTGKTTVAARLLALLLARDETQRIAVAAPTGRAAARLVEAIGDAVKRERLDQTLARHLPAQGNTLHRLLGYRPLTGRFTYHAGNPLTHDIVVIDEASMVDLLMMDALVAAVRPGARIIVLGDPDQLASVDTGFVLGDVARAADGAGGARHTAALAQAYATLSGGEAALVPHRASGESGAPNPLADVLVRLRTSWRFGTRPGIGALATAAQRGDADAVLDVLENQAFSDVALQPPATRAAQVLAPVLPQVEQYLATETPIAALAALSTFRVLCALRDGETGVAGLNASIERWLVQRGHRLGDWYSHRPVLVTANDPASGLFNGDVGVTLLEHGVPMVHFPTSDGGVRTITPSRLPAHETAWAMTIHKSQGSEFDHVVIVLPDADSRILTRELLYTGITRARQVVTLLASTGVVRTTTQRSVSRHSGLVARLRADG
jgi:exodeoxyribonuclease V alpha subunit